jgi:DNA replication protein DnaC
MTATDLLVKNSARQESCERHGDYEAKNIFSGIWTRCPRCADEAAAREQARRDEQEQQRAIERWRKRLEYAGIPDRFRDRSLKSYVAETDGQRRALAFAESYAETFDDALRTGRSAVFIGKLGTGKTHLAIGIGLRVMHRDGRSVAFSTVMRMIKRIRNTWGGNGAESETEASEAFTRPDLLILDEVGGQYGSEAEKLLIFDILNERYNSCRPTLLLSNLDLTDVRANLGERVYDRLREDGGEVVVFDWTSYRGTT